jgi:hypothetical protein
MHSMTEAVLAWAAPYLNVEGGFDENEMRAAMEVAVEIWNAMVLDAREGGEQHLVELQRRFEVDGWPPQDIVGGFVDRKRREFASDLRLVDHFGVRIIDGEVAIHVAEKRWDARPPRQ